MWNLLSYFRFNRLQFKSIQQIDRSNSDLYNCGVAKPMTLNSNSSTSPKSAGRPNTRKTNTIQGTSGRDRLTGTDQDDKILGVGNDDRLEGRGGNDRLEGGADNDLLIGNDGNDRLLGGGGQDQLKGGAGKDTLRGSTKADVLNGGSGNDNLGSGNGDDRLLGGDGDDRLVASGGSDVIVGGFGDDRLTGGGGKDRFAYNSVSEGRDRIVDFNTDEDKIDLSEIFKSSKYNNSNQFRDYLVVVKDSGDTLIRVDPDGEKGDLLFKTVCRLVDTDFDDVKRSNFIL